MKIGISTAVNTGRENWERMQDLLKYDFKHIEFYNKITRIRYEDIPTLKKIRKQSGISFSFHSMVQDLFSTDLVVAEGEYFSLMSEIRISSLLGCRNIVFHITKKTKLTELEFRKLRRLVRFAKKQNIALCLENNSSSGPFSTEYLQQVLSKVKGLSLCVDIGHLKVAVYKKYMKNYKNFLNNVGAYIYQFHVSYNDGKKDLHDALTKDGVKWLLEVLEESNIENPCLVIETRNIRQAMVSKTIIQRYV